jgi:hypothetical protein
MERAWRVGHHGRDQMYYEELRDGVWERIAIDGEMLMGRAHHVIYFATPERWLQYPAWARERRDEIIARIVSEFREPDYEYLGVSGSTGSATGPVVPPIPPASAAVRATATSSGNRALLIAMVALFALSATMGWLVATGVGRGSTYLPLKQSSLRRAVLREQEPAMFWVSVGIYATIGAGAAVLGLLAIREGRRR